MSVSNNKTSNKDQI